MDASNTLISEEKLTRTYKRRWAIIFIVLMYNFGVGFGKAFFGQVNDVYAQYYSVSVAETDWLTIVNSPSSIMSSIAMAWLASTRTVGLRKLCLVQCGLVALGFTAQFVAVLCKLYPIAILGQLILGCPGSIGMVSTQMVAVTWFPPKETGIAIGLYWAGISTGITFGFFIPSRMLKVGTYNDTAESVERDTQTTSMFIFGSACALFYLLFLVTYFVVLNKPSLPPGNAEIVRREAKRKASTAITDERGSKLEETYKGFRDFISGTWYLMSDRTYLVIVIAFGLAFSNDSMLFTLMSDVVASRGGDLTSVRSAEQTSGFAMSIYGLGHLMGGILAGKLIDCTKRYKLLACGLYLEYLLAALVILLGIILANFPLLCVGTILFGIGTMSAIVSSSELASQHMYPTSELMLTSWLIMVGQVFGIVFPLVLRVVFDNFGYLPTVAIQTSLLGLALILLMFTKPKYHRLRANSMKPNGKQQSVSC